MLESRHLFLIKTITIPYFIYQGLLYLTSMSYNSDKFSYKIKIRKAYFIYRDGIILPFHLDLSTQGIKNFYCQIEFENQIYHIIVKLDFWQIYKYFLRMEIFSCQSVSNVDILMKVLMSEIVEKGLNNRSAFFIKYQDILGPVFNYETPNLFLEDLPLSDNLIFEIKSIIQIITESMNDYKILIYSDDELLNSLILFAVVNEIKSRNQKFLNLFVDFHEDLSYYLVHFTDYLKFLERIALYFDALDKNVRSSTVMFYENFHDIKSIFNKIFESVYKNFKGPIFATATDNFFLENFIDRYCLFDKIFPVSICREGLYRLVKKIFANNRLASLFKDKEILELLEKINVNFLVILSLIRLMNAKSRRGIDKSLLIDVLKRYIKTYRWGLNFRGKIGF